jgi:hypothetical protein
LPGVKPVTQFGNPKVATERIWRVIQELGVRSIAEPVIELRLGVIEIVARDQANGFPQPN